MRAAVAKEGRLVEVGGGGGVGSWPDEEPP
jgi:hypothetical protein